MDEFLEDLRNLSEIDFYINVLSVADKYLRKVYALWKTFEFIDACYPEDTKYCPHGRHEIVKHVEYRMNLLGQKNFEGIKALVYEETKSLMNHINAAIEISKTIKEIIKPCDITKNYCSGWLSPEGDYFGLNGEVSNLLHNVLADAIRERMKIMDGVDVLPTTDCNMDGWLMRNGWVRLHGDWILYDGWSQGAYGMPVFPMTERQIAQLVRYANSCYKGILKLGIEKQPITSARLEITEIPMLAKYFEF